MKDKSVEKNQQESQRNHPVVEYGFGVNRRQFLKLAGISALAVSCHAVADFRKIAAVSLIVDPADPIAGSVAVRWATQKLEESLIRREITVHRHEQLDQASENDWCVVVAGSTSLLAQQAQDEIAVQIPSVPEALGLLPFRSQGKQGLVAGGQDERGLVYALLELADRVHYAEEALSSLSIQQPTIEQPANVIRSNTRLFTSDVEDKGWFNDREMWPRYLDMLATQRYNRFNLSLGIGYDFLRNVEDAYFLFAYPFFLSLPDYEVSVSGLPEAERKQNLEMLQFISEETVKRGLEFQLGIWMHGYEWIDSPNPNYQIVGLTPENHGPYCRDAVRALLQACPAIHGITFRIHGESGVNEGRYNFWETVFDGVATCGRRVEIDMHAKGMNQSMIDTAQGTGMPVVISPKYWAEHMGMPYHQADIRQLEVPKANRETHELMKLSQGSRSFMRYGYGDLLREDRNYEVLHRIWPGTQRFLLWGDPLTSAAHSRAFSFCGSAGAELMEPLSFKGRRGSGVAGGRCGYKDTSLEPRWDWEKYLYSHRVFGRSLYNPKTEADVWRRYLRYQFGTAAEATEAALANATRILPIVLTSHGTSAGNNTYWPEMYTNQPIVQSNETNDEHLYDTPSPKVFGNVSPMDPQLFLGINAFAGEMLAGERSGKYTPIEVAQWIEDYANEAENNLTEAQTQAKDPQSPEFRRMNIDVSMQIGLGRFFGAKFRSGVLYGIYDQSGDRLALQEALSMYRKAREHWVKLAQLAEDVYQPDLTIGERTYLRGHWMDRLPAIDQDIEAMAARLEQTSDTKDVHADHIQSAIEEAMGRPKERLASGDHQPPDQFQKGEPLRLSVSFEKIPQSARLYYRHVNQAERYQTAEMTADGNSFQASIPAEYTDSPYPLQYYFELKTDPVTAWLYPGFDADLANQPYLVVRETESGSEKADSRG